MTGFSPAERRSDHACRRHGRSATMPAALRPPGLVSERSYRRRGNRFAIRLPTPVTAATAGRSGARRSPSPIAGTTSRPTGDARPDASRRRMPRIRPQAARWPAAARARADYAEPATMDDPRALPVLRAEGARVHEHRGQFLSTEPGPPPIRRAARPRPRETDHDRGRDASRTWAGHPETTREAGPAASAARLRDACVRQPSRGQHRPQRAAHVSRSSTASATTRGGWKAACGAVYLDWAPGAAARTAAPHRPAIVPMGRNVCARSPGLLGQPRATAEAYGLPNSRPGGDALAETRPGCWRASSSA